MLPVKDIEQATCGAVCGHYRGLAAKGVSIELGSFR